MSNHIRCVKSVQLVTCNHLSREKGLFEKESNVTLSLNFCLTFDRAAGENTINVLGTLMSRGVMHVKEE